MIGPQKPRNRWIEIRGSDSRSWIFAWRPWGLWGKFAQRRFRCKSLRTRLMQGWAEQSLISISISMYEVSIVWANFGLWLQSTSMSDLSSEGSPLALGQAVIMDTIRYKLFSQLTSESSEMKLIVSCSCFKFQVSRFHFQFPVSIFHWVSVSDYFKMLKF